MYTYVDGESHFHGIVRVAGPFAPEVEVGEWVFGVGHCFVRSLDGCWYGCGRWIVRWVFVDFGEED